MKKLLTLIIFIWFGFASVSYSDHSILLNDRYFTWVGGCSIKLGDQEDLLKIMWNSKIYKEWKESGFEGSDEWGDYMDELDETNEFGDIGCVIAKSFLYGFTLGMQ